MPTDQILDDDIDRALRDLLPPMPSDRTWERAQRNALVEFIESDTVDATRPVSARTGVASFEGVADRRGRRRPALLVLAAAAIVVIVAGGLVLMSRARDVGAPATAPSPVMTGLTDQVSVPPLEGPTEVSPAPVTTGLTEQLRVPPLEGLTEGQARQEIDKAGLTIRVGYRDLPPGDPTDGTVIESPPAGESVDLGSEILVIVGRAAVAPIDTIGELATPPSIPDLFPLVTDSEPRAAEATAMYGGQVGYDNAPSASALVARDVGGSLVDGIELAVSETVDTRQFDSSAADPIEVAGQRMLLFATAGDIETLVLDGTPALIARGLDPIAFIEAAGGFPIVDATIHDDGEISFRLGELPDGYSVVSAPARLARGSVNAITSLPGGSGPGLWATVDVVDPRPMYGSGGPLTATEVNGVEAWANGATLMWKVGDITWVTITGAVSLDAALSFAGSIELVDEATWRERYHVESPEFPTREHQEAAVAPSG